MKKYSHTQAGTSILLAMAFVFALLMSLPAPLSKHAFVLSLALFILFSVLFCCLTIQVRGGDLCWFFGPRFWQKKIPLADIKSATEVQISWFWGWGIRLTPLGWMYHVSGTSGVKIQLFSGETILLGTNDPKKPD